LPAITSRASMSIHEESTIATLGPMMGVFNNLVMFDQHVRQNSLESIVPDLAVSWAWSEDAKELTFKLRRGVKWHDGKPSPPPTSSAPGTWSPARRPKSSGSIRASRGTATSMRSSSTAMTRSPSA